MLSKSLLLIASSLISFSLAWDPKDRDCDNKLCLTSFIWCDPSKTGDDSSCNYPDNVYPYEEHDHRGPPAVIQWSSPQPYNITWQNHNPDFPVTIRWTFPSNLSENSPSPYQWEYNTSTPSPAYYLFNPNTSSFPNATNITGPEALGLTAGPLNALSIYQFEAAERSSQYDNGSSIYTNALQLGLADTSDQFFVEQGWAISFAQNYRQRLDNEWEHKVKLGVGIGVGLGVPVLLGFTAALTMCCARRQRYGPVEH